MTETQSWRWHESRAGLRRFVLGTLVCVRSLLVAGYVGIRCLPRSDYSPHQLSAEIDPRG